MTYTVYLHGTWIIAMNPGFTDLGFMLEAYFIRGKDHMIFLCEWLLDLVPDLFHPLVNKLLIGAVFIDTAGQFKPASGVFEDHLN